MDPESIQKVAGLLQRNRADALKRASWHGPVTALQFEDVLRDPLRAALVLAKTFAPLGMLHQRSAAQIVQSREPACAIGFEFDLAQVRSELWGEA